MWFHKKSAQALLVFLIPLVIFSSNLDGTWIMDDHYQVEQNPYIRSPENISRILTTRVWKSTSLNLEFEDIYRPVFLLSYMVDYALFGIRAFGFHLLNNLLHSINAVLLFFLIRRFCRPGISMFGALLFALHPICVEGVSWIGGRMDLLMAFFSLANIHLALKLREDTPRRWFVWALYALTIPFGLFSKETFVLVPFLGLLAVLWTDAARRENRTAFVSMFAVSTVLTAAALWWRQEILGRGLGSLLSPINLWNFTHLIQRFALLFVMPTDTEFFLKYAPGPFRVMTDLAPFCLLVLVLFGTLWIGRRNRGLLIGIALFVAPLLPVALVLDILGQINERYLYLPLAGMCFALVVGADQVVPRSRVIISVAVIWLLSLSAVAISRSRDWHDEVRFFTASTERNSAYFLPYFYLASHYMRTGEVSQEVEAYYRVLERNPAHIASLNNLAVRLIEQKQYPRAKKYLERAYRLEPKRARTSFNMGFLQESQGAKDLAAQWYRRALALDHNYTLARNALARVSGTNP